MCHCHWDLIQIHTKIIYFFFFFLQREIIKKTCMIAMQENKKTKSAEIFTALYPPQHVW